MSELSDQQKQFAKEYAVDFNGTQAAIRAGYSKKTAGSQASSLLKKLNIQEEIAKNIDTRSEKAEVDAMWVLNRLMKELTADAADIHDEEGNIKPIHEWPLIWRQGLVAGFEVQSGKDGSTITKVKISDRIKRLELLGKHIDIMAFATKIEHDYGDTEGLSLEGVGNLEFARRLAFLFNSAATQLPKEKMN